MLLLRLYHSSAAHRRCPPPAGGHRLHRRGVGQLPRSYRRRATFVPYSHKDMAHMCSHDMGGSRWCVSSPAHLKEHQADALAEGRAEKIKKTLGASRSQTGTRDALKAAAAGRRLTSKLSRGQPLRPRTPSGFDDDLGRQGACLTSLLSALYSRAPQTPRASGRIRLLGSCPCGHSPHRPHSGSRTRSCSFLSTPSMYVYRHF